MLRLSLSRKEPSSIVKVSKIVRTDRCTTQDVEYIMLLFTSSWNVFVRVAIIFELIKFVRFFSDCS